MAAPQFPQAVKRAQAAIAARQQEAQLAAQQAALQVQRAEEDAARAIQDTQLKQRQAELQDLMAVAEARQSDEETAAQLEAKRRQQQFQQQQKAQAKRGARSPAQDVLEKVLAGTEANGRNLNQTSADYAGGGALNAVMESLGSPGGPQPGSPGAQGPSVTLGGQTYSAPPTITSTQTAQGVRYQGPAGPFDAFLPTPYSETTTTTQPNVMTPAQVLQGLQTQEQAAQDQRNWEAEQLLRQQQLEIQRRQVAQEQFTRFWQNGMNPADAMRAAQITSGPVTAEGILELGRLAQANPDNAAELQRLTVTKLNSEIRGNNALAAKYEAEASYLNGEEVSPSSLFGIPSARRALGSAGGRSAGQELGTLLEGLRDSRNKDGKYDPSALTALQYFGLQADESGNPVWYPDEDGNLKVVSGMQVLADVRQVTQGDPDSRETAVAVERLGKLPFVQVSRYPGRPPLKGSQRYDVNFTAGPDKQYQVVAEAMGNAFGTGADSGLDVAGSAIEYWQSQQGPGPSANERRLAELDALARSEVGKPSILSDAGIETQLAVTAERRRLRKEVAAEKAARAEEELARRKKEAEAAVARALGR